MAQRQHLEAIEILQQNPLRTGFQEHCEQIVKEHVFRAYPTLPSPFYGLAA